MNGAKNNSKNKKNKSIEDRKFKHGVCVKVNTKKIRKEMLGLWWASINFILWNIELLSLQLNSIVCIYISFACIFYLFKILWLINSVIQYHV